MRPRGVWSRAATLAAGPAVAGGSWLSWSSLSFTELSSPTVGTIGRHRTVSALRRNADRDRRLGAASRGHKIDFRFAGGGSANQCDPATRIRVRDRNRNVAQSGDNCDQRQSKPATWRTAALSCPTQAPQHSLPPIGRDTRIAARARPNRASGGGRHGLADYWARGPLHLGHCLQVARTLRPRPHERSERDHRPQRRAEAWTGASPTYSGDARPVASGWSGELDGAAATRPRTG